MKTPADETPAAPTGAVAEDSSCPCELPPLPNVECVDRVKKLPLVEAAWNQSTALYNNVKGYNPLLTWTLGTAEATVNLAVEQTLPFVAPIAKKLETPIGMVDKTLCKGLDAVENAMPCIKQEPAQIKENAKTLCDPAFQQVKTLQELSWVTANQILKTNLGAAIVGGVDNLASTADKILDFLLPPGEPLGVPRAEKVMQALTTIGGIPQRAARRGYETLCSILQTASQQDFRQNMKTILTLIQIQSLVESLVKDTDSERSTPVSPDVPDGGDSTIPSAAPQAQAKN